MSKTERKDYDDSFHGLLGLGQIITPTGHNQVGPYVVAQLQHLLGAEELVSWDTLNQQVISAYEAGEDLYFTLGKEGEGIKGKYSDKTEVYGISTGYRGKTSQEGATGPLIYGFFYRVEEQWIGLHFATESQMMAKNQGETMGKLVFTTAEKKEHFLQAVAQVLLPGESWSFGTEGETLDILQGYFTKVTEKLYTENTIEGAANQGKLILSTDSSTALFHSGLLNKFTGDIYVIGAVLAFEEGGYLIQNPSLVTGAKDLTRNGFDPSACPEKVEFYDNLGALVFAHGLPILLDEVTLGEIIEEAAERGNFPSAYDTLCTAGAWSTLVGLLKTAVEKGQKIAKYDYKYVLPQYAEGQGDKPSGVQFLLPVYLQTDLTKEPTFIGQPDFVLVLEQGEENYVPRSIIKLREAYLTSKLIGTPDNAWMQASPIQLTKRELVQEDILGKNRNWEAMVHEIGKEAVTLEEPVLATEEEDLSSDCQPNMDSTDEAD